jgi:hypothetical protein
MQLLTNEAMMSNFCILVADLEMNVRANRPKSDVLAGVTAIQKADVEIAGPALDFFRNYAADKPIPAADSVFEQSEFYFFETSPPLRDAEVANEVELFTTFETPLRFFVRLALQAMYVYSNANLHIVLDNSNTVIATGTSTMDDQRRKAEDTTPAHLLGKAFEEAAALGFRTALARVEKRVRELTGVGIRTELILEWLCLSPSNVAALAYLTSLMAAGREFGYSTINTHKENMLRWKMTVDLVTDEVSVGIRTVYIGKLSQ